MTTTHPEAGHGHAALGVVFLICAMACFAVLDTAVKVLGAAISILVAVWFRYLFQAVAVTAVMLPVRRHTLWQTAHLRLQLLRGVLLLAVSALSFVSVQFMPLGEFTAFVMITPLPMTMHFYTGWVGALVSTAVLPFAWQAMPETRTFSLLGLVGLMGTVGHFLMILAFARTPASTLTPFAYSQIGFAMLCGWLVFDHVPGALESLGIVLIVACGITASWLTAREQGPPALPSEP